MGTPSVDFQLLDNGTVKFTLTVLDAKGNPTSLPSDATPPVFVSSDTNVLTVAPDPADASGLTAIGTPVNLGTGVTVTATNTYTAKDGSTVTVTGTSDGVDVVAGPAASFKVVAS